MRPSSWNGVGAMAKVPAAWAVSFVILASISDRHSPMCNCTSEDAPLGAGSESITTIGSMDSGLSLREPRNDILFKSPRRLLDLLFREEDLVGVGDDILGLPSRERRRPAFHFHHPQLADTTGTGDAEHLAGLIARQIADHV